MKYKFKNMVITGALILAPVLAASPTMAAPKDVATQVPNFNMINIESYGFYFNTQNWSELLDKLGLNIKPVISQPDVTLPDNSKPESSTPESSKPETSDPVKPSTPVEPSTPVVPSTPVKPSTPAPEPSNPGTGTDNGDQAVKDDFAAQVVDLVNQERAKVGLQPLKSDSALTNVAMLKAKDMYNNNYFDHNSPTLGSPFDLMNAQGIQYRTAGENIAKGQRTPAEVMNAWMNSDGHRKNILSANYTTIGVAYYNGVWVQEFIG
ncbi:CAP domain-containing protein [Paenibacillus sp. FSL K6-2524]|uniref:CAP domain-containing protein n=1 Tax=Paenibacillus sp. FSL K6-2524 TaxID=2954516 RepID=UPI0030FBA29C